MRRFFRPFCLLFTAAMFMASCLNSDNDTVTYYDDAAITAFSLSNAKITRHTKSSTGEDSTYIEISSDVANYPFVIDQIKGEIYNVDSLPLGTDPTKILCNYSTKNNSYAGIKSLKSDSIAYFNTADSIDFSSPREVSVYSSSGVNVKKYKITVNIHKEKADSFVWKQMPDSRELASLKDMKAYNLNGEIVVLGTDGQKTRVLTINASNGRTFTDTGITLETNSYNNAVVFNNELYVIDNGTLKTSKDAKSYDIVTDSPEVIQLLAASTQSHLRQDGRKHYLLFNRQRKDMDRRYDGLRWQESSYRRHFLYLLSIREKQRRRDHRSVRNTSRDINYGQHRHHMEKDNRKQRLQRG